MNTSDDSGLKTHPALRALAREMEPAAWRRLVGSAQLAHMPAGMVVFQEGDPCRNYFLVLDGEVKVALISENGRELLLYRVGQGQSCVMTTIQLLAGENYEARGIVQRDVTALVVPAEPFEALLADSAAFRRFVFSSFAIRLHELIFLVGEVAFTKLDRRLAALLADRARRDGGRVRATHEELAAELGATREAISRLLKEMERSGLVKLGRGHVDVPDPNRLHGRGISLFGKVRGFFGKG